MIADCPDETWDNFSPIEEYEKARKIREGLRADGLVDPDGELEWVTIPDPGEVEFPFHKRHPGQRPKEDWPSHLSPAEVAKLRGEQVEDESSESDGEGRELVTSGGGVERTRHLG